MNADLRAQMIALNTENNWFYIIARNMLHHPLSKEHPCPSREERAHIRRTVERVAFAIQIGGFLQLQEGTQQKRRWIVTLTHKDNTTEEIGRFRRRKRAEAWVANMYMFALDKPRELR